jgi:hypothetical protein
MSTVSIPSPYPAFADIDGQPLEDGYIWIGTAGLQPIGNPINVYWDAAQTIAAAQPIRTRGGYPMNSGTPARLFAGADYSIQVQNKNGSVIYTSLLDNLYSGGGAGSIAVNATGDGVQTIFPVSFIPSAIYINGVYQNQNSYSVSGGNVTFTQAPPQTSVIEFVLG